MPAAIWHLLSAICLAIGADTQNNLLNLNGIKKSPVLFADRDLYNPTTFLNGTNARAVGLQTSRGCAEFGRREHKAARQVPTCYFAGYFKHITAVRDSRIIFS